MFITLAQSDVAANVPNAVVAQPADHFDPQQWIPHTRQVLRGGAVAVGVLLLGVLLFAALRKYLHRAKLAYTYLIVALVAAIYFGIAGTFTHRLLDRHDIASIWIHRVLAAVLLYAALRVLDRLVIVPLMSRGGTVPMHRFLHQFVIILIFLFTILGYGAWGFDWDIDKFLAGSAVISIVLGLALQETLGNFFSGLVMHASSPFSIGDWIVCAGVEGRVADMTWRAVTLHTLEDNYVIVPNGTVAKEQIVNFHTPTTATARMIDVGLDYDLPPEDVVALLKATALETPGVSASPEPFVFLDQFSNPAIIYRLKFWITEPRNHKKVEHAVRMNVWYRLKQNGFGTPYSSTTIEHIAVERKRELVSHSAAEQRYKAIADQWLFAPLSETEKRDLAANANDLFLAAGQVLFRQDDSGESLYVIRKGEVDVLARHGDGPETAVATLKAGDFFGEMSALTGQPRTATIRATSPLACVQIHKSELQPIFAADPSVMEKISVLIAERNAERLMKAKDAAAGATREDVVKEQQKSLFGRMLKFFSGSSIAAKP